MNSLLTKRYWGFPDTCNKRNHSDQEKQTMLKKTVTAISVAALAGVGAMSVLPDAMAKSITSQEIIELA